MDWYVDARDPAAVRALRHEFRDYVRRHADPGADVGGAELVVSELITNAFRHAPGPAWVHVDWSGRQPVVEVHDLGPGFVPSAGPPDPARPGGRGIHLATALTDELTVAAKRAGGSRVTAVLAVTRTLQPPSPPAPRALPLADDEPAGDEGEFSGESFLRALVVEMARSVELDQGPAALQALVAQVGASVGARAERRYRRTRGIAGPLTPEQIADACVSLKAALGGDFRALEVSSERIVLGCRACPFGEAVRRAPGLCQVTTSVLGGIAGGSRTGASVQLLERIAVGDPECRIVVSLGERCEETGE